MYQKIFISHPLVNSATKKRLLCATGCRPLVYNTRDAAEYRIVVSVILKYVENENRQKDMLTSSNSPITKLHE